MLGLAGVTGGTAAFAAGSVPAFRSRATDAVRAVPPSSSHALNRYQLQRLDALRAGRLAATDDTLRVLALQVEFADTLMNKPGTPTPRDSTWMGNELEHMAQYFRGASRQHLQIRWTLDATVYKLPRGMAYYGSDTRESQRVVELVETLIGMANAKNDFSRYDHVFVIHAGAGQETDIAGDSPIQLWSSFYDLSDIRTAKKDPSLPGLATADSLGGKPFYVDNFSIVPSRASQDLATIGTLGIWAFQVGSRIGLVPLFDSTPSKVPDSQGVGAFDLMGYGLFDVNGFVPSFPCAFNRVLAGWVDPVVIDAGPTEVDANLADINTGAETDTLCVKVPITESEYYLVVNRVHDANFDSLFTFGDVDSNLVPNNWDSLEGAEFDFFLTDLTNPAVRRYDPRYGFDVLFRRTGSGVYIWHVDERVIADAIENGYLPDDFVARKGVDLEEADGVQDLDRGGSAAFSLGSYYDSYRLGDGNASDFGPKTNPASTSNAGVTTGIEVQTLSVPAHTMRVAIRRQIPYTETRARWKAASPSQPATAIDLDGDGVDEIVVLSDSAGVYVFNPQGGEWVDRDGDPTTIEPFIPVPGVTWTGPPAFANLDGVAGNEIVATSREGDVYAWKSTGAELVDGDANPATQGVLFHGEQMAAPPMLVDINGDGVPEISVAEHEGSTIRLQFVDATGAVVTPPAPLDGLWPATLDAQLAAPLALAGISDGTTETVGVVAACVDTTLGRVFATWTPLVLSGSAPSGTPVSWTRTLSSSAGNPATVLPSAPAVGDMDGDGDDEIVIALADGSVHVLDAASAFSTTVRDATGKLRSTRPSAPALGDIDGDGTLEIAIWDAENMYLLKSNARLMVEWPRAIRPESAGAAPAIAPRRGIESPLFADMDGDGRADVVFPLDDGTLTVVQANGLPVAGFPRVAPSEMGAAPSLAEVSPGTWRLVALGSHLGLGGIEAVTDSLLTTNQTTLSIQSLPRPPASPYWTMSRVDPARTGRTTLARPLKTASSAYDPGSFMIYPNPVPGAEVHARISTNAAARVHISIYTVEGQEAVSRTYDVNPNGLVNTPFDEAIDVHKLKSGLYLLRLRVESDRGSGTVVKPFAIRR